MLGIAFELLNLASSFVDVGEQAASRFAVEARGWDEGVASFSVLGPRLGVELGPIIPPLLGRKGCKMTPRRPRIESLVSFGIRFHRCVTQASGTDWPD